MDERSKQNLINAFCGLIVGLFCPAAAPARMYIQDSFLQQNIFLYYKRGSF
jgi:hypothetical protein